MESPKVRRVLTGLAKYASNLDRKAIQVIGRKNYGIQID